MIDNHNSFMIILYELNFFFIKTLKGKKKKLAITSFYYLTQKIKFGSFMKNNFHRPREDLKLFYIPSKYFRDRL